MTLGGDGWPIASHAMLIAVLMLLAWRVMHSFARPGLLDEAERRGLSAAMALACTALVIERMWFIFSRAMRARGVDVYGLHPVPELVAFLVASTLYGVCAVLLMARLGAGRARRGILIEAGAFLLLWGSLAAVLT